VGKRSSLGLEIGRCAYRPLKSLMTAIGTFAPSADVRSTAAFEQDRTSSPNDDDDYEDEDEEDKGQATRA
jgi:hypothetical protein